MEIPEKVKFWLPEAVVHMCSSSGGGVAAAEGSGEEAWRRGGRRPGSEKTQFLSGNNQ